MKALVTGHSGFVGKFLLDYLHDRDIETVGLSMSTGVDIRNYEQVRSVVESQDFDLIFHLAAQAYVAESVAQPARAMEVNTFGTLNLLEAVKNTGCRARILLAGTSEEYGYAGLPALVDELAPTMPTTPYGVSKLAAGKLGAVYAKQFGLNVVMTRAYNHTGPGRSAVYADAAFAKRVVQYERGLISTVLHGNLDAVRNYSDVRDVVRAYGEAIWQNSGYYNVCSDQDVSMRDILSLLTRLSLAKEVPLKEDPALVRPAGHDPAHWSKPTAGKLYNRTGWAPEITLEQTLQDCLTFWRNNL